jgi:mono/diheme cytochrome c family protein
MYTGLKHLHHLLVLLFLLSILIKLVLLFLNSNKFETFRNKVKWPEMIATILFLVLGIVMIVLKNGSFHTLFWVKLGMVLIAIPLTIIGFKKKNKILSLLGVFVFIMSYGVSEMATKKGPSNKTEISSAQAGTLEHGKILYENNCITCHGESGDKQLDMAANLQTISLSDLEIKNAITQGKGSMPSFASLSEGEVDVITNYLKTLASETSN